MNERCHCGGIFAPAQGVVAILRCEACRREVPATALGPFLRLPKPDTYWLWALDQPRARLLLQVVKVQFNGEEWWITTRSIPEAPVPMFGPISMSFPSYNNLDHFWEMVTPVGGRVSDLSDPISLEQYRKVTP